MFLRIYFEYISITIYFYRLGLIASIIIALKAAKCYHHKKAIGEARIYNKFYAELDY